MAAGHGLRSMVSKRPASHPGCPEPLSYPTERRSAVQSRGDKAAEHGLRNIMSDEARVASRWFRAAVTPDRTTKCCEEQRDKAAKNVNVDRYTQHCVHVVRSCAERRKIC